MGAAVSLQVDSREFTRKIGELHAWVQGRKGYETPEQTLRTEMRLLVERCVHATPPHTGSRGGAKEGKQQGETAVKRDINKVFTKWTTLADNAFRNPKVAKRARQLIASGDNEGLKALLNNLGVQMGQLSILDAPDAALHKSQRDQRGRVFKNPSKRAFVKKAQAVTQYVADIKKHVGFSKAGWMAAVNYFKCRSIPAWVKRHGAGQGSYADTLTNGKGYLEAKNKVQWIGTLDSSSGILDWAVKTRTRDIQKKIDAAMRRASERFNRK